MYIKTSLTSCELGCVVMCVCSTRTHVRRVRVPLILGLISLGATGRMLVEWKRHLPARELPPRLKVVTTEHRGGNYGT